MKIEEPSVKSTHIPYSNEKELLEEFLEFLRSDQSPWGKVQIGTQFSYSRGRTDIIAVTENQEVIAFEVKLSDWREAAHQAYRNTCFANHSYVVLPIIAAKRAAINTEEFRRRNIGICSVQDDVILILEPAPKSNPIQPWLYDRAVSSLAET